MMSMVRAGQTQTPNLFVIDYKENYLVQKSLAALEIGGLCLYLINYDSLFLTIYFAVPYTDLDVTSGYLNECLYNYKKHLHILRISHTQKPCLILSQPLSGL